MLRNSYWSTKQSISPAINESYTEMFIKNSGIDAVINERVQKIKSKYGTQISFKDSFKNAHQCQSMWMENQGDNCNSNKENKHDQANVQNIPNEQKQSKNQKHKIKGTGVDSKSYKIRELEQINLKISKMIQNLKLEQQPQQSQHSIVTHSNQHNPLDQSSIIPLSLHPQNSHSRLNITKLSKISVENSKDIVSRKGYLEDRDDRNKKTRERRVRTQSDYQYDTNKSLGNIQKSYRGTDKNKSQRNYSLMTRNNNNSSHRQIGKIGRSISARKSAKQNPCNHPNSLKSSQHELGKILGKQVQYDQKYQNYKTKLTKITKKFKNIIAQAVKNTILSQLQKQLLLEWNLQDEDPLFTQRNWGTLEKDQEDDNHTAYQIVDSFIKAQDHWRRKVVHKFNKDINLTELDEGKGYFLKEDLTRFVSLQCKQMYCNRDINTIFRRINRKKNKIVPTADLIAIIGN